MIMQYIILGSTITFGFFCFSPPAKTSRFDFSGRPGASLVDDDYSDDEEPESN